MDFFTGVAFLPGAGELGGRVPDLTDWENCRVVEAAGVGRRLGWFLRSGDSGRDSDGRVVRDCLKAGLDGRAPGPTDCANFGLERADKLVLGSAG